MPISEDEYDSQTDCSHDYRDNNLNQNMSKAELRKTNKPIMEKKRRARINNCLNELKDLLLDAMKKDPARHSKLEKADILELTVKHLQSLQRQQLAAAVAADPAVLRRFRDGFGDCAREVRRYLSRHKPPHARAPPGLPQRLDSYLDSCVNSLHVPSATPAFASHGSAFRFVGHHERPSPPSSPDSACDDWRDSRTPAKALMTTKLVAYPTPPSGTDRVSEQDSSPETQKATVSSTTISPETKIQMQRDAESKTNMYVRTKPNSDNELRRAASRNPNCSFPSRPLEAALDFSTVSGTTYQVPSEACSPNSSERICLPLDIITNYSAVSKAEEAKVSAESPVSRMRALKRSNESSFEVYTKCSRVLATESVIAHGRHVTLRAEADTSGHPSTTLAPGFRDPAPASAPAPAPAPSTDTMWRPW